MTLPRRLLAPILITALVAGGGTLQGAAANAADVDAVLLVEGRLVVAADEGSRAVHPGDSGSPTGTLTYIIPEVGPWLSVDPIADIESGSTFSGEVVLPKSIASDLGVVAGSSLPSNEGLGLRALERVARLSAAAELGEFAVTAPRAAATVAKSHVVDIAIVDTADASQVAKSDAEIQLTIGTALAYWIGESKGAIPTFPIASLQRYTTAELCRNTDELWADAASRAGQGNGSGYFDGSGRHLLVITGPECQSAGPGLGLGTVGASLHEGGATYLANVDDTMLPSAVHELGHNMSLDHAFVREYDNPAAGGDAGNSADYEYEDLYSPMGFAVTGYPTPPALGPGAREALGFSTASTLRRVEAPASGSSVTEVTVGSGAGAGLTGLRVADPLNGRVYFVEYRDGTGREAGSAYTALDDGCLPECPYGYGSGVHITRAGRLPVDQGSGLATYGLSLATDLADPNQRELALDAGESFRSASGGVLVEVRATASGSATLNIVLTKTPGAIVMNPPTVTGSARQGDTLTASVPGRFPADTTFAWQWKRDGVVISGATSATYVPVTLDVGARLAAVATGSAPGYSPSTVSSAPTAPVTTNRTVTRVTGTDRFGTSVEISRKLVPTVPAGGVDTVFVANGLNFPDALAASPAAIQAGAPILLVAPTFIPSTVATELARLSPRRIVVLGDTPSVDANVARQLASYSEVTPVRITGSDRFGTSRAVAEAEFSGGSDTVFIVTGLNYPDAMLAAVPAGRSGAPILLVNGGASRLDDATAAAIENLGATRAVIVGGLPSVSAGIAADLEGLVGDVVRLTGTDRYGTSVAVAAEYFPTANPSYFATGLNYPDALTGSVLAASTASPLLLAPGICVTSAALDRLDVQSTSSVVVFGAEPSLNAAAAGLQVCR